MNNVNPKWFLFIVLILGSCKKENLCDCLISTGKIISVTKETENFNQIKLLDNTQIIIHPSSTSFIVVEAGENIIKKVKLEVNNHCLTVFNTMKCNFVRVPPKPVIVHIYTPTFSKIIQDGSGDIKTASKFILHNLRYEITGNGLVSLEIDADTVTGGMTETGDIQLIGKAKTHSVNASGNGFVLARNFVTNYTYLDFSSTGYAEVNATGLLQVIIRSYGHVYYTGTATVEKELKSTGQLIKL